MNPLGLLLAAVVFGLLRGWLAHRRYKAAAYSADLTTAAGVPTPWSARFQRRDSRWLKVHRGF